MTKNSYKTPFYNKKIKYGILKQAFHKILKIKLAKYILKNDIVLRNLLIFATQNLDFSMANHAATKKDVRQSTKRNERNRYYGKTTRNAIRDIRTLTDKKAASEKLPTVESMIDKLAQRGTIHKNKAANLKRKLALKINRLDK